MRLLPILTLALAAAAPTDAAQILVPGDHPSLQAAIDAAAPGDVIVVTTQAKQDPVVVDKALTILGDPWAEIYVGCDVGGCGGCAEPQNAVRLDGPGEGTVTLANVRTQNLDCFNPAPHVGGGGFDELHLYNAECFAWSGLTGLGDSAPTVRVDVPYVLVEGSHIRGGIPDSDQCAGFLPNDGYAAIDAPASTVVVLNSTVVGGGLAFGYCCVFCACGSLPSGGAGGAGVVANELFLDAASTVVGGTGSTFTAFPFPGGAPTDCGKKPDGVAFIASSVHALPGNLVSSSVVPLGGTWTLDYDVPGPAVLFLSSGLAQPLLVPGAGYAFLAAPIAVGPVPAGGSQTLAFAVPPAPVLLGLEGGFQILDATLGLTAPGIGLLGP